MKQLTFYKYTTLSFFLLNIVVIGFFLLNTSSKKEHQRSSINSFQKEAVKILNLDSEQESSFMMIAEQHEKQIRKINKEEKKLLISFFENIPHHSAELDTALVLKQFGQIQQQKLRLTQQHLADVREILNEDQLTNYEEFTNKVIGRIISKKKKRTARPKDF